MITQSKNVGSETKWIAMSVLSTAVAADLPPKDYSLIAPRTNIYRSSGFASITDENIWSGAYQLIADGIHPRLITPPGDESATFLTSFVSDDEAYAFGKNDLGISATEALNGKKAKVSIRKVTSLEQEFDSAEVDWFLTKSE